jgi:hypothetical protein
MMVQERPACGEKEQYGAAKQRQRAVRASPPRYGPLRIHNFKV